MNAKELLSSYNSAAQGAISTEDGLEAAEVVIERARKQGVEWALAGGIAMHVYGFLRATQDVDLLASATVELPSEQPLSFGGASYSVFIRERKITIDVIVRDDFFRNFYEAALRDAKLMEGGWRVVTPEWMVIIKFLAGRSKDILDLLWLLQKPGLVDRAKIAHLLEEVAGATAAQLALRGLEPYYIQANVMRAGDENGK